MSAQRGCTLLLLGVLACSGCRAHAEAREPPAVEPPPAAGAERAACPRVERAKRMWSGFAVDVPSSAMVHALDEIVPIQKALGEIFCAEERRDCRPSELLSIDLTDEHANRAQLRVALAGGRELGLTVRTEAGHWQAEPESLALYLAQCAQPGPQRERH